MLPIHAMRLRTPDSGTPPPVLWTPADLTAPPFAWYNDTSAVNNISGKAREWNDISGAGFHLSAYGGAGEPYSPTINGSGLNSQRTLTFNPSGGDADNLLRTSGLPGAFRNQGSGWVMAVVRRSSTDGGAVSRSLVAFTNGTDGSSRFVANVANTTNTPALFVRRLDGDSTGTLNAATALGTSWGILLWMMDWTNGDGFIYRDGQLDASNTSITSNGSTSNTDSLNAPMVGAYPGTSGSTPTPVNPSDSEVAEIIIGRGLPDSGEIDKLFGYAAHRWGLVSVLPALHPYKSSPP